MVHGSDTHFLFILTAIIRFLVGNIVHSMKNTLFLDTFWLFFAKVYQKRYHLTIYVVKALFDFTYWRRTHFWNSPRCVLESFWRNLTKVPDENVNFIDNLNEYLLFALNSVSVKIICKNRAVLLTTYLISHKNTWLVPTVYFITWERLMCCEEQLVQQSWI